MSLLSAFDCEGKGVILWVQSDLVSENNALHKPFFLLLMPSTYVLQALQIGFSLADSATQASRCARKLSAVYTVICRPEDPSSADAEYRLHS